MSSTSTDKLTPAPPDIGARLAALEGRLAGSWASYTREEYEKNLREGIKQDILTYVSKMAIGLLVFLGGAGYLFIRLATQASYVEANKQVVQDLHAQYAAQVKEDRRRIDWQRYHNYGVNYRYLAQLYSWSPPESGSKKQDALDDLSCAQAYSRPPSEPGSEKQDALDNLFCKAKTYYDLALGKDQSQSSSHFEIAQLYYKYARDFDVPKWKKSEAAFEEYQRAADLATPDEIANGWRAQSLTMMGAIELDGYRSVSQSSPKREGFLREAEAHLKKAKLEYENANPDVHDYVKNWAKRTSDLLAEIDKIQKQPATAGGAVR